MTVQRVSMHKIKEVLRLKYATGLKQRQIAAALGLSNGVVAKYLSAAESAHLPYPWPADWDDTHLAHALFGATYQPAPVKRLTLDFPYIHQELKRKGVTRQLLWDEYRAAHPEGYGYTQFCVLYTAWLRTQRLSMRQVHRAGEKLFVDYCGQTVPIINAATGEVKIAQVFVATLGASSYTFAEATWSQSLSDWIGSHVRAFAFFGGVPQLVVPDNLKSGVSRACRYEPLLNASYHQMLTHYGCAALPARPYKPRDKAKVEVGVQVVTRWILARLRRVEFFSLADLNRAIQLLLEDLNTRPFKKLPGSRHSQFHALDRPALRPLPAVAYEFAQWQRARVGIDYHIEVDRHYYSVPHQLARREVEVRLTASVVEVLHTGKRVAAHVRSRKQGSHTTEASHLPKAHRAHLEWTPGRFLNWAHEIGPNTRDLVRHLLFHRPHPEMGYRSCLGLLSLAKRYGHPRLEAACQRSLRLGAPTRTSVRSILQRGLDALPLVDGEETHPVVTHENVRGANYYH